MPEPTRPAPRGHLTPDWKPMRSGSRLFANSLLPDARLFNAEGRAKQDLLVDARHIVLYADLGNDWLFYLHKRSASFRKMLRRKHGATVVSPKFHKLCLLLADTAAALQCNTLQAELHCYEAGSMSILPSEDIAGVFMANAPAEFERWRATHGQFPEMLKLGTHLTAVDRWTLPMLRLAAGKCRGINFEQHAKAKAKALLAAAPATATAASTAPAH